MYDFQYIKPKSLADAIGLLSADLESKAVAGGMTFIPVLKQRLNMPTAVVDLSGLGLAGIRLRGGRLVIGALTTHAAIAAAAEVNQSFPALADLAGNIGDRQVRHRGTIGGSLANNDPSACFPAAVLATGASIITDRRQVEAEDFFLGTFTTALEPGELITSIEFPLPDRAAYVKFPNPASRYAMVGVFVGKMQGGVRVAVTGAGQNGVFRHAAMEMALTRSFSESALDGVSTPTEQMTSDMHGSAEYKAHLVGVMAKRAVAKALT
jgi:carbon-monoxide dehydrogenase medium subunit